MTTVWLSVKVSCLTPTRVTWSQALYLVRVVLLPADDGTFLWLHSINLERRVLLQQVAANTCTATAAGPHLPSCLFAMLQAELPSKHYHNHGMHLPALVHCSQVCISQPLVSSFGFSFSFKSIQAATDAALAPSVSRGANTMLRVVRPTTGYTHMHSGNDGHEQDQFRHHQTQIVAQIVLSCLHTLCLLQAAGSRLRFRALCRTFRVARHRAPPEMVPPVPAPATRMSTLPCVCLHISGPVVS